MDDHWENKTVLTRRLFTEYSKAYFQRYRRAFRSVCMVAFLVLLCLATVGAFAAAAYRRLWFLPPAAAAAGAFFLFLFFRGYRFGLDRDFRKTLNPYGEENTFRYSFSEDGILQSSVNLQKTIPYRQVSGAAETRNLFLIVLDRQCLILDKNGFPGSAPEDPALFLSFLAQKCPDAGIGLPDRNTAAREWAGRVFAAAAVFLLLMQLSCLLFGGRFGFSYIGGDLPGRINRLILLSALVSVQFFGMRRALKTFATVALLLLFSLNLTAMRSDGGSYRSTVSFSPGMRRELAVGQDSATGKTTVSRDVFLLFARPGETLPYTAAGMPKLQWLTSGVCAATYREPDGKVHQYVATYGDPGGRTSYLSVEAALGGSWQLEGKNTAGRKLTADTTGITVTDGAKAEHYAPSDCVQSGTLALNLCRNGLPEWTVALGDGCGIGPDGLIEAGGTVVLCPVSMGITAPLTFVSTSRPSAPVSSKPAPPSSTGGGEKGGGPAEILAEQFEKSPDLSGFQSRQDLVRVKSDSTDPFEVGLLAMKENAEQFAGNGYDSGVRITEMQLLAGDSEEFLIEIKSSETSSGSGGSETAEFDRLFRVRKGKGVFLAVRVGYGQDGASGLKKLDPPRVFKASGNPEYRFSVPARK